MDKHGIFFKNILVEADQKKSKSHQLRIAFSKSKLPFLLTIEKSHYFERQIDEMTQDKKCITFLLSLGHFVIIFFLFSTIIPLLSFPDIHQSFPWILAIQYLMPGVGLVFGILSSALSSVFLRQSDTPSPSRNLNICF